MILAEDIITVHQFFIKEYGGIDGISELGSLESAKARPFQTFGGEDLYQPICEKAAAPGESLIMNRPFIVGNKRTGFLAMTSLLP